MPERQALGQRDTYAAHRHMDRALRKMSDEAAVAEGYVTPSGNPRLP